MVIGGAEIYAQAMPLADRLEITQIHAQPGGRCALSRRSTRRFGAKARAKAHPAGPDDDAAYDFVTYLKANAANARSLTLAPRR